MASVAQGGGKPGEKGKGDGKGDGKGKDDKGKGKGKDKSMPQAPYGANAIMATGGTPHPVSQKPKAPSYTPKLNLAKLPATMKAASMGGPPAGESFAKGAPDTAGAMFAKGNGMSKGGGPPSWPGNDEGS